MEEVKIPAHIAIIAARSSILKDRIMYVFIWKFRHFKLTEKKLKEPFFGCYRLARDTMNEYLEKQLGATDIPLADQPTVLDVKIPDALPEAFEKVLHYIYTDRIDCKLINCSNKNKDYIFQMGISLYY